MIKKENRFTQKNFEYLRKKMKAIRLGNFLFLFMKSKNQSHCSVVIPKKIEKSAVKRIQFKRKMYETFRKELLPKTQKCNVICLYKGEKITQNKAEILNTVKKFTKIFLKKI